MKKETKKEKKCKHENVVPLGIICSVCGSEEGYCKDCDAEMVREHFNGEWEES